MKELKFVDLNYKPKDDIISLLKIVPNKMSIKELGQVKTFSKLKTTLNLTLVDEKDFNIDEIKTHFDKDSFFIKISPINKNTTSEKHKLGDGIIQGVNLI